MSFQLSTLESPRRTILSTKPGFVYASQSALYVATDGLSADNGWPRADAARDVSVIHKFSLESGHSVYRGSAPVRRHVLNQLAMDEQGVLALTRPSMCMNVLSVACGPVRTPMLSNSSLGSCGRETETRGRRSCGLGSAARGAGGAAPRRARGRHVAVGPLRPHRYG